MKTNSKYYYKHSKYYSIINYLLLQLFQLILNLEYSITNTQNIRITYKLLQLVYYLYYIITNICYFNILKNIKLFKKLKLVTKNLDI